MMDGHVRSATRYFLVGVANTVIYSSLLWGFLSINKFPHFVSIGLAYIAAMHFQYFANKFFTFGVYSASFDEFSRYLGAATINYFLSVFTIWICLNYFNFSTLLASLFSAVSAAAAGYFLSFFWVYKR